MSPRSPVSRATRSALTVGGLVILASAVTWSAYRGADGFVIGRAAFPIAAGLAALVAAALMAGPLRNAAPWAALAIVGQASALRLINAGTSLHYAHYLDWSDLVSERPIEVGVIALQGLLVIAALAPRARALRQWLSVSLGWWRAGALAVVLVLLSATLSEDVRTYARELVTASTIQLVNLGTLVLLVRSIPADALTRLRESCGRLFGTQADDVVPGGRPGGADRFAYSCAIVSTVLAATLAVLIYQRHPHVQDEVKYLFHARYFAAGLFAVTPPSVPPAFNLYLLDIGPKGWYSVVPPGWPAILAIGAKLGAPWLVNPVLNGVNIVLAYVFLRSMYGLRTARLATALLTVSPWYVFLGMSFMPHAATLSLALLGALGVERSRRTGLARYAFLAGAAAGFASLVRQLDGLLIALVLGLWAIGIGGRRIRLAATAALVTGTAAVAALTIPYNAMFTGRGLLFPIMVYNDRLFGANANAYGFGPDRGMGWALDPNPGHGPIDAAINSNLNATGLNVELFGWSVGSLLLIALFLLRGRLTRTDRAMVGVLGLVFLAYFFNYFSGGPDFGARYWYLMVIPAVALTARAVHSLGSLLDWFTPGFGEVRALAAIGALACCALVSFFPWRALDKYRHYLGMRPDVVALARTNHFGRSLVLVRGREHPDYSSAATYNPLDLRADVPIFAHDVSGDVRRAVLTAYADRPVWIVDGPSRTGAGYRVVQGPIQARALLATERGGS